MTAVPEILGRAKELVDPAIAAALAGLHDELRVPAEYHFEGRGKGVRPAVAILSAEAVGAPSEVGLPGAVAIELIHDFSLIHDDIIDGDTERRHRTTVWAKYGTGLGIIVGDALHALAFEVLLNPPTPERVRAARELANATAAMIAGQSMDMAFDERPEITLEQCLEMERGKTGALLSYASSAGAILAGADDVTINLLADYGMNLGSAFQAVDDLLGIWGDPERTGKPAGSDLRERKRSIPVVIALHSDTPAAAELAELYSQPHLDNDDVNKARTLVEVAGGREGADALARTYYAAATDTIEQLTSSGAVGAKAADELRAVAKFIVGRDF